MERRKITYVGWRGNLGDEALCVVNQKVFGSYELVSDHRMFSGKQCSRISLFGGGTLLPFTSFWVRPNRYNYAFGVGVRDLTACPEFHPREVVERTKRFHFRLLGVRGEMSRRLLGDWGIDSEVVGDPCLLLEPRSYSRKEDDLIILNLSSLREIWGRDSDRIALEGIKLCRTLKKEGYHIVLIPFRIDDDSPCIMKISRTAGVEVFDGWNDPQATIDFIASSHVVIGEILPSTIFSASTYTPFVMIAYQPKCFDFVNTVGFAKYAVRTDEMTSERVITLFNDLLEHWDDMQRQLKRNVEIHRRKLRDFASRIIDDIESRGPDENWLKPNVLGEIKWRISQRMDRTLHNRACRIWRAWHRLKSR